MTHESHGTSRHRLLQQRQGLGYYAQTRHTQAQGRAIVENQNGSVHNLAESKALFEQGDGLVQVPLAEGYRGRHPNMPRLG